MRWEEWCNSEYKKMGFYIQNKTPYAQNGTTIILKDLTNVLSSDIIIDAEYIIQSHSGGDFD